MSAASSDRPSLSIIGVGAFGELAAKHLAPHFNLRLCDATRDLSAIAAALSAKVVSVAEAAQSDIIVLAVPTKILDDVVREIALTIHAGTLVLDVCSVKVKPINLMRRAFPDSVDIVGTHPLFGPQSGKNGIAGLNIALCPVRGRRYAQVARFLRNRLGLKLIHTSGDKHDQEMAYVQGLTHLIAKVVVSLDLPQLSMTTKTFDYMQKMVEMVRYDSDELFRTIERENPYTLQAKQAFFSAARRLEERLSRPD